MYVFVKTDSLVKTAKQVRNVVLDPMKDLSFLNLVPTEYRSFLDNLYFQNFS